MVNPDCEGKYFNIKGSRLTIFGSWGEVKSESTWLVYSPNGVNIFGISFNLPFEIASEPVSQEIERLIAGDRADGRDHLIEYIAIKPIVGIQLWLEGKVTREQFEAAVEGNDGTAYVEISEVMLDGKSRKVRIYEKTFYFGREYSYATFDSNGEIV